MPPVRKTAPGRGPWKGNWAWMTGPGAIFARRAAYRTWISRSFRGMIQLAACGVLCSRAPGPRRDAPELAGSVRLHLREELDHRDAGDDQPDTEPGRQVRQLAVQHAGDQRDQDDACAAPDCVGDTHRHGLHHLHQQEEGRYVARHDEHAGEQPGEILRGLQAAGGDHFGHDGEGQEQVAVHCSTVWNRAGGMPATSPDMINGAVPGAMTSPGALWRKGRRWRGGCGFGPTSRAIAFPTLVWKPSLPVVRAVSRPRAEACAAPDAQGALDRRDRRRRAGAGSARLSPALAGAAPAAPACRPPRPRTPSRCPPASYRKP